MMWRQWLIVAALMSSGQIVAQRAQESPPSGSEPPQVHRCVETTGGLDQVLLTGDGRVLVDWSDDRVELRRRQGETIWVTDFRELPGFERVYVYDLAEERPGNSFLVLGVEAALPPRMVLFRLFASDGQAVLIRSDYDLAPVSVVVDPQGRRYLLALSAARFNRLVAAGEERGDEALFEDFLIHEIDAEGEIQSSYFRIREPVRRWESLSAIVEHYSSHRLLFSPRGGAFLRHLRQPWVSEIDLGSGTRGRSLHIAGGGFSSGLYIPTLQFIGEDLLSAMIMSETGEGLQFEIRNFDLRTGTGWTRLKGRPGSTPASVHFDNSSESVVIIPWFGPSRAAVVKEMPVREFGLLRTDPAFETRPGGPQK